MADHKQTEGGSPEQAEARSAEEQVRSLFEAAESRSARAFEELVAKPSFGVLLARSAENVAALSRIGADLSDLVLRNLRIAGRADIVRLSRQLHRTEDKLERLLQEIEQLRDALGQPRDPAELNGGDPVSHGSAGLRNPAAAAAAADK